jgi:hypothetical protein
MVTFPGGTDVLCDLLEEWVEAEHAHAIESCSCSSPSNGKTSGFQTWTSVS